MKALVAQSCIILCNPMDYSPWSSPGKNIGVGSHSLPQSTFPTQGLNPGPPNAGIFFTIWATRGAYIYIYIYIYIYSGTELLKCYVWDFLGDKNNKGVLIFVINPCWPHLSLCWWGNSCKAPKDEYWVSGKPTMWFKGWNFHCHPFDVPERERG